MAVLLVVVLLLALLLVVLILEWWFSWSSNLLWQFISWGRQYFNYTLECKYNKYSKTFF